MPTLDDIANNTPVDLEKGFETQGNETEEYIQETSHTGELLKKVLTAETGEGNISDYLDHPMNFSRSMGLAQILRGVTGIIGNLKLAIIDIGFGALRFSKEKRGNVNDVSSGGDFPS